MPEAAELGAHTEVTARSAIRGSDDHSVRADQAGAPHDSANTADAPDCAANHAQLPDARARLVAAIQRLGRYANYAYETIAPHLPRLPLLGASSAQMVIGGLIVRCDREIPTDPAVLAMWEDLYNRTPSATPFQSPAWQQSLLQTPQALRRLRFFTIYDGHRLVGVLPLEARVGKILRTSGAILTDYLDPLMDPVYVNACWPAVLLGIRELAPGRSLVLENVREETCGPTTLDTYASATGFALANSSAAAVARIELPKTWDAYLASLDRHERKELKRKLNKAEQQAGAKLLVCDDPKTVVEEIHAMFDLLDGANSGKSRKAKWLFPRHFAASAPALAASGRLVLYKLMLENKHAAGLIALPTHHGQILWNTAFDSSMKQWSPGIVLFAMLIRRAIEHGDTTFDLLRGQYDYKYRLGAADHPLRTLTLKPAA